MAGLPRLSPPKALVLKLEPLSPEAFAPFGTAIVAPVSRSLHIVPETTPGAQHPKHQPKPQFANQQTALKTSPISPLVNNYPVKTDGQEVAEGRGLMSIFSCFPRKNTYADQDGNLKLKIGIVERHPYTTQTFCPFNFSQNDDGSSKASRTYFLVVVAPTIQDTTTNPSNPPDLSKIRAFVAPVVADGGPGMAVTYNAGTWHAPMIVLGHRRIDFLVTQFANGVGPDDCQEVLVGGQDDADKLQVEVDLSSLGLSLNKGRMEKARL